MADITLDPTIITFIEASSIDDTLGAFFLGELARQV